MNGVLTRVFTAEHLAAICLQVGRPKDHDRVIRFVEAGVLDAELFEAILQRHVLVEHFIARKVERRRQLAALPVGEKLRMWDELVAASKRITATMPPKPTNPVRAQK